MAVTDSRPTSTGELVIIVGTCAIVLLFGLFLLLGGTMLLWRGRYTDGSIFLAFGALVTALGGGGMVGGIKWVRGSRGFAARRTAHPGEPWLWREDWVARRVADHGRFWTAFFWVFAIVWNAASWPMGAAILALGLHKETVPLVLAIGMPLAGLCLIGAALYFAGRLLKFGRIWFLLDDLPYRRGGMLAGRIVVARGARLTAPVTVGIRNRHVHQVREPGEGRETRTQLDVLWEGEPVTVQPDNFMRTKKSVVIPLRLTLPAGATATDIRSGTDQIDWVLAARSDVRGVDFAAEFEVPVF